MQPFALDRWGRVVLPSTMAPQVDLTGLADLDALRAVVRRDVDAKAPDLQVLRSGAYASRYALLRDLALHLFWRERFALRLYERRAVRWCDVPRRRADLFLPVVRPWAEHAAVREELERACAALPAAWDDAAEARLGAMLLATLRAHPEDGADLPVVPPTVAEALQRGGQVLRLAAPDPDPAVFGIEALYDVREDVPELEALHRWAMVLHDQRPWQGVEPADLATLAPDDVVLLLAPRDPGVRHFLHRVSRAAPPGPPPAAPEPVAPVRPYRSLDVPAQLLVPPRLEALAVVHGDVVCSNDDVVRNAAPTWSAMTAGDISSKTGIEQRRYSTLPFEEMALRAATAALDKAGRRPEEIGAVLVATCTSPRLMPSTATWLSGRLGMAQTYASYDLVAACAGLPYGLADAARLLQEVERPVLLVCIEKFSDQIGDVRTSRMIFGDGAAALVIGPGERADLLRLKTYASGPLEQVTSIVWPDAAWGGGVTVFGPPVKALAGRYLTQMIEELQALPDPDGQAASLLESVDLVVPHQANKTMVLQLAERAGLSADRLFFNIGSVGNTSAASIPLALHDAVREGVVDRPLRVFAPGFGAGAVAGYAVLRVDPAVVAVSPRT